MLFAKDNSRALLFALLHGLESKELQQFLNGYVVVSGYAGENTLQSAYLDRAVIRYNFVVFSVDLGSNANVGTRLSGRVVAENL